MSCASISKTKWDKILQENIIPVDLAGEVSFTEAPTDCKFQEPKDYPNVGMLRVKNVFSATSQKTMVCYFYSSQRF